MHTQEMMQRNVKQETARGVKRTGRLIRQLADELSQFFTVTQRSEDVGQCCRSVPAHTVNMIDTASLRFIKNWKP